MHYFFVSVFVVFASFGLLSCLCTGEQDRPAPETPDWRMTLKTIRNGIHKIDTYLNAALDLFGGEDGLCHYKCSDGFKPGPRYNFKPPPPNGCGSPLFGVQFDIGIPSMTKCCNQHDRCYDTCGSKKHDCDEEFQFCLSKICRGVQKTLGLSQNVQACESAVGLLFDAVMHLGCKPYLDSQRSSCMCRYEEKVDLWDEAKQPSYANCWHRAGTCLLKESECMFECCYYQLKYLNSGVLSSKNHICFN